jgi:hypothetical protein
VIHDTIRIQDSWSTIRYESRIRFVRHETNLFEVRIRIHNTVRIHGFAKRIHVLTNLLYDSRILKLYASHLYYYFFPKKSPSIKHNNALIISYTAIYVPFSTSSSKPVVVHLHIEVDYRDFVFEDLIFLSQVGVALLILLNDIVIPKYVNYLWYFLIAHLTNYYARVKH